MLHFIFKTTTVTFSLLLALCASALFSSGIAGGDHYEIYLNKKLLLKQFVGQSSSTRLNLPLDKVNDKDLLSVYYSHCGQTGKGRRIQVKNGENHILKEWKFADAKGADVYMSIWIKDIMTLKKNHPNADLNLYYFASDHLPRGRMLASIAQEGKNITLHRPQQKVPLPFTIAPFGLLILL